MDFKMKLLRKIFYVVFVSLSIISCQTNNEEIKDIIQPIKLTAGKTDSIVISDLFFADKYNLNFNKNKNIQTKHSNGKLFLTPDSSFEGMTLLDFKTDMNTYEIPIISKKEKYYEFDFKPSKDYKKLTLFGSFNGWDRTNLPMTDKDGDGIFSAKVSLEPGVYQYKFFGDGEEIEDSNNPEKVSNGMGSFNSIKTIEETNNDKLFIHIKNHEMDDENLVLKYILEYKPENFINKNEIFALFDNSKIDEENISVNGNEIEVKLNENNLEGKHTFRIAVDKNGQVSNIQTVQLFDGKPADNSTFTWNDGIIYSLMIDRFNDGDPLNDNPVKNDSLSPKANYMGGDLKGILDKLNGGYFDSLGVNIIWISPVYDNPNEAYKEYPAPHRYYSGYHGYWPISSDRVEEHFGTVEDVKKVVATAHQHGIKILLDFVSNHVHIEHPFYKEHRDWFGQLKLPDGRLNLRFWDEFRLTTWFEPYLPSFDYLGSNAALEKMTDVAVWWLKETGADGYRHDAVKHVPNEFWRRLNEKENREVASKRKLPVYQIGETFGSYDLISSYVNNGQLNAQFNFNLYDVALPTFIKDDASFTVLDKEMHKTFSVYGVNHLMGNIMDSHDKNRFMAFADGDLDVSQWSAIEEGWNNPPKVDHPESYKKLILYMAYMNSIPGLPVVYYGSEFGMTGASDPDNRRMMRFGDKLSFDEKNTLSEVSKIIHLRRQHPALRYGDFYTLQADENIYAFIRSDMNERILVVINKSKSDQEINLIFPDVIQFENITDLATQKSIPIENSKIGVTISSSDWRMFKLN
jgi:cyclomaltodextrinase / maltogenic alpha-amylase / neopullulanase